MSCRTLGAGLVAISLVFVTPAVSFPAPGFSGTYKGDQIVVTLTGDGPQLTGTIEVGGKKYTLAATAAGNRLAGTFKADGGTFKFTAILKSSTLTFETDGTTYLCQRQDAGGQTGPRNPLARGSEPKPLPNPLAREAAKPGSQTQPTSTAPGTGVRFTRLSVKDPGINNIEAVSFLIPAGWKAEGGIQWFRDYSVLANLLMKVTDPQTGATIEFLPIQNFTWLTQMVVPMSPGTNYLGNILYQPVTDLAQFIQLFYVPGALRQLQSARIVSSEDLPKVAAQVAQTHGGPCTAKSGRMRYEYQAGGQPWEEDVYVTLVYTPMQQMTLWSVTSAYAFRAPKGHLDRLTPVMNTTINTQRLSPDWYGGYMYVQKLFLDRMNQGIRNAGAISDTITRNSEEIRRMFDDSYRQRCQSQDRISQSYSEYIRGVETYRNPYEDRPIQLPTGYANAWVNRSGEYILSPQSGFDPNIGSNTEWRRLERTP
jgi:hypothetical protein